MKAVIPGPRASIRTGEPAPVFYFYVEDKAAGLGNRYFGGNLSNPNQFALMRLEVPKSNRETIPSVSLEAFSASSGTDSKPMTAFTSERIHPGFIQGFAHAPSAGPNTVSSLRGPTWVRMAAGAADIFTFAVRSK